VVTAVLAGFGLAYPTSYQQQELWDGYFDRHYAGVQHGLAKRIFANSGVVTRHAVLNPYVEDVSGWSTGRRMERYLTEALPLGKSAVGDALAAAALDPADVGLFAVCSCTGYATPGLDILLARDLGMSPGTQRLFVGHMGCYAALPSLGVVADFVRSRRRPAVLLCCELTSLHVQPPTRDAQQIVAHALFSDAAAALVLRPVDGPAAEGHESSGSGSGSGLAGWAVVDVASVTDVATADYMTWNVTDLGFRMGLSQHVPDVLDQYVAGLVDDLLGAHGLGRAEVAGWAVHPGGPRILTVVQERLGLTDAQLAPSWAVLAEHGNCSSPTVLVILERITAALPSTTGPSTAGRYVVALAFGPGLTLYAALLRRT
jgi:predicted naringenin-chalcone synthase